MITKLLVAWLIIAIFAASFLILDKKDFPVLTIGDLLITVIFWPVLLICAFMGFAEKITSKVEKIMSKNIRKED